MTSDSISGSISGVLVLDKPAGISSAGAVSRIKRLLPRGTKIGHAGTLDPFATGVLLLLIGKATKLCEKLMDEPKQYETTIKLGANTVTDDRESPEEAREVLERPSAEQIEIAVRSFVGPIQQRPPIYSAIKIGGRPAYDLARKGHDLQMQPRTVRVYGISTLNYEWPFLWLRIDCGRGTYIRSIARDLGELVGVGGYLMALRRTRVGPFGVDDGVTIERVIEEGACAHLRQYQAGDVVA